MGTKKYLSLDRLTEYHALIKQEISNAVSGKADASHTHNDTYYTESEIDTKIAAVNTSIDNITSGTVVVKEAEHATSADTANTADSATTATTATKLGSSTVGSTSQPVYIKSGTATKITAVGTAYGGTGATTVSGARTNLEVYSKAEVDSALSGKAASSHNHDSAYDAKGAADTALASAKTYADSAAAAVKNDLLNGAGTAYDTLKELGDLIDDNADAIDALEAVAAGKANATHSHAIADVSGLQTALNGKANSSHGTHVTYSTTAPVMDGTASVGTASTVARSDHKHPTDTSRASQADLDALEEVVAGKANSSHTHTISNITNLQSTLDGKASASHTHSVANISDLDVTATELNYMDGVTSNVQTQLDGKAASSHGHSDATTSAAGFMTAAMVTKLNGIATGANKTTVDSALSSSSANPVQNKVINSAISSLTSTVSANTSSISQHTTAIGNLQTAVAEFTEITSAEIQALFA